MVLHKGELEAKLKDEHQLIQSGVLRDENPLDLSDDFNALLMACREGDLKRCQELITLGANINGKDHFDYTPLIVVSPGRAGRRDRPGQTMTLTGLPQASLCGHFELVQLLLESGMMSPCCRVGAAAHTV